MAHHHRRELAAPLVAAFALLAATTPAWADRPQRRVAVLEFDVPTEFPAAERDLLGEKARQAALQTLPADRFSLMTRESIAAIARDNGKDCAEGECEVDTLRIVSADYGCSGRVLYANAEWVLTVKVHESASGAVLAIEVATARDRAALPSLASDLTRKALMTALRKLLVPSQAVEGTPADAILTVTADPDGEVYLDGRHIGKTPINRRAIPPGDHLLVIAAVGYSPMDERLTLRPGQELTISKALIPAQGFLDVAVKPEKSTVIIDGSLAGPGRQGPFAAGTHRIRVGAPGHRVAEVNAEVVDKATTPVTLDLEPLPGRLMLRSNAAARCEVADQRVVVAPYLPETVEVPAGEHSVSCKREGDPASLDVKTLLAPGGSAVADINFAPRAVGAAAGAEVRQKKAEPASPSTTGLRIGAAAAATASVLALGVAAMLAVASGGGLMGDTYYERAHDVHALTPSAVVALDVALVIAGGLAVAGLLGTLGAVALAGVSWGAP